MALPTYGTMAVDWENRVDFDRLRRERLARAKALLANVAKSVITRRTAEVVAHNQQVNDKRNQAEGRREVGAGGASPAVRTRKLTPADTATMTDDQIMDL